MIRDLQSVPRQTSVERPSAAELVDRARAIAGIARERAFQTETARRVSDDMIARMRQADLFRIMQPQAYGGFEYGFDVLVRDPGDDRERLRLDRMGLRPARFAAMADRVLF